MVCKTGVQLASLVQTMVFIRGAILHPVHKPWFVKQAWVQYCTHGFWLWVIYGRHAGLQRLWLWFLLLCIHCTQRMIVADGCCCTRSVRCTQPCVRGVSSMAVVRRFAARGCAEDSCSRLWRRAARETPGRHPGVHEKEYSRARRRRAAAAYPSTRIDARHPPDAPGFPTCSVP